MCHSHGGLLLLEMRIWPNDGTWWPIVRGPTNDLRDLVPLDVRRRARRCSRSQFRRGVANGGRVARFFAPDRPYPLGTMTAGAFVYSSTWWILA